MKRRDFHWWCLRTRPHLEFEAFNCINSIDIFGDRRSRNGLFGEVVQIERCIDNFGLSSLWMKNGWKLKDLSWFYFTPFFIDLELIFFFKVPKIINRHNRMILNFKFLLWNSSRLTILHVEIIVKLLNSYFLTINFFKSDTSCVCATNQINHYFITLALIRNKHNCLLESPLSLWRE